MLFVLTLLGDFIYGNGTYLTGVWDDSSYLLDKYSKNKEINAHLNFRMTNMIFNNTFLVNGQIIFTNVYNTKNVRYPLYISGFYDDKKKYYVAGGSWEKYYNKESTECIKNKTIELVSRKDYDTIYVNRFLFYDRVINKCSMNKISMTNYYYFFVIDLCLNNSDDILVKNKDKFYVSEYYNSNYYSSSFECKLLLGKVNKRTLLVTRDISLYIFSFCILVCIYSCVSVHNSIKDILYINIGSFLSYLHSDFILLLYSTYLIYFSTKKYIKLYLFLVTSVFFVYGKYKMPIIGQVYKKIASHYRRFCFIFNFYLLFSIINIFFIVPSFFWFSILCLYSVWIPEIVQNIIRNRSCSFPPSVVLLLSLQYYIVVFYFLFSNYNIYLKRFLRSKYVLCYLVIQNIICILQFYYGPYFFLPSFIKPQQFQFKVTDHGLDEQSICTICLSPLIEDDVTRTPCSHYVHVPCLRRWFVEHSTCPTCRSLIPEMQNII